MSKAKASQFVSATRTIEVPLTFEVDGKRTTEPFKVIYRAFSPAVSREIEELEKGEEDTMTKVLAKLLVSIPEITNGDDHPIEINEEILEQMAQENLRALHTAIAKDVHPTPPPTTSTGSPDTSEAAAGAKA